MPYPATQTYWLEPTDRIAVGLRRYHSGNGWAGFTCEAGYHSALVFIGEEPAVYADHEYGRSLAPRPEPSHDDERWPAACHCGYRFTPEDRWQDWTEMIYRRTDTGELVGLRDRKPGDVGGLPTAPPGASWDAWWMHAAWRGPDGIALMVRCPNGHDWHVDGRASNCGRPDDDIHQCWVRHGDPRECLVTGRQERRHLQRGRRVDPGRRLPRILASWPPNGWLDRPPPRPL